MVPISFIIFLSLFLLTCVTWMSIIFNAWWNIHLRSSLLIKISSLCLYMYMSNNGKKISMLFMNKDFRKNRIVIKNKMKWKKNFSDKLKTFPKTKMILNDNKNKFELNLISSKKNCSYEDLFIFLIKIRWRINQSCRIIYESVTIWYF